MTLLDFTTSESGDNSNVLQTLSGPSASPTLRADRGAAGGRCSRVSCTGRRVQHVVPPKPHSEDVQVPQQWFPPVSLLCPVPEKEAHRCEVPALAR